MAPTRWHMPLSDSKFKNWHSLFFPPLLNESRREHQIFVLSLESIINCSFLPEVIMWEWKQTITIDMYTSNAKNFKNMKINVFSNQLPNKSGMENNWENVIAITCSLHKNAGLCQYNLNLSHAYQRMWIEDILKVLWFYYWDSGFNLGPCTS
jgi:hypothetical protein